MRDLPLARAVRVLGECASVEAARVAAGCRAVVVVDSAGQVQGVVASRAIRLAAQETPARPVGELARSGVAEVEPTTCLVEAVRAVSGLGVGALLVRSDDGWLITREELLAFDAWGTLFAARENRLSRQLQVVAG